ncbi:MAG: hypothetical protein HYY17_02180 [Planctomycetes bacterium]|nr:hypothetical protein [Planctomycetota bacterium]
MSRRTLSLVLASVALAGCGPNLGSPEDAARAVAKKETERRPKTFARDVARLEWELDCDEKELEWWADRGSMRNDIDRTRAKLEFRKDNRGKIRDDITFDVVDIRKGRDEKGNERGKRVVVHVWSYEPVEVVEGSRMFYLKFARSAREYHLVEAGKEWKIANKK